MRRRGSQVAAKSAITEGIKAFLRVLPGSWDLVFSDRQGQRGNTHRQKLVPLHLELERLVGTGGRDPLIRHLLEFGMKETDVAQVSGMGLPRVKGIRASLRPPLASSA